MPVLKVHKIIIKLKLMRINHNRFIFITSIFYFWGIVGLLLGIDWVLLIQTIWENAPIVVIVHAMVFVSFFPFAVWLLRKYDSPKSGKFWQKLQKDSFLTDQSVNYSLNQIEGILHDIDAFEKND